MTAIDDALIGLDPGQDEEFEILAELSEDEKTAWDEIRTRIERREETLSFSAIKAFRKSPFHFVRYKLKKKVDTPGLIFGDYFDCITLTPGETKERFASEPVDGKLNSLKGCDVLLKFYGEMFQGELDYFGQPDAKTMTKAQIDRISELQEMIAAISQALNAGVKMDDKKQTIKAAQEICSMKIVSEKQKTLAEALKNRLYRNDAASRFMNRLTSTQVAVEFSAFGWKWKCKLDGESDTEVTDLKVMARDASFEAAQRTIRAERYTWQGALYTIGARQGKKKFYNICLDASLGVTVVHINRHELVKAWNQIEECVADFERCIYEGLDDPGIWFSSYDFFAPRNGVYEYGTYNY
jgi:PDDEXK-like domain of unknown function (DUF3799)